MMKLDDEAFVKLLFRTLEKTKSLGMVLTRYPFIKLGEMLPENQYQFFVAECRTILGDLKNRVRKQDYRV